MRITLDQDTYDLLFKKAENWDRHDDKIEYLYQHETKWLKLKKQVDKYFEVNNGIDGYELDELGLICAKAFGYFETDKKQNDITKKR